MTRPTRASAIAATDALRDALARFVRTHPNPVVDASDVARWESEGGPAATRASQEADDRASAASERGAWSREPASFGDGDIAVALRGYTRTLRRARVGLAPTLAAVRAVFAEYLTPRLSYDGLAEVQRDVARSCLQAYFEP